MLMNAFSGASFNPKSLKRILSGETLKENLSSDETLPSAVMTELPCLTIAFLKESSLLMYEKDVDTEPTGILYISVFSKRESPIISISLPLPPILKSAFILPDKGRFLWNICVIPFKSAFFIVAFISYAAFENSKSSLASGNFILAFNFFAFLWRV